MSYNEASNDTRPADFRQSVSVTQSLADACGNRGLQGWRDAAEEDQARGREGDSKKDHQPRD
jgi:hypothetical protein